MANEKKNKLVRMKTSEKQQAKVKIIEMTPKDAGKVPLCWCKDPNNECYQHKFQWIKKRMSEGLKVKMLNTPDDGIVGYIEYVPGEYAWRAVNSENYMFIHCIYMEKRCKGRGYGTLLIEDCVKDAKKSKCRGVAVVTSSDSFMAGSGLFIKAGFVSVESSPPYELLVKKFKKAAPDPRFIVERERVLKRYKKGLTILAADQCPMVPKCVKDIAEASRALGLKPKVVRVRSAKESRELPTPYGVFSIVYDGKLIAERPISGRRFINIMWDLNRGIFSTLEASDQR